MENEIKNTRHMTYTVQGMTCVSCVNTIQSRISTLLGVTSANVSLTHKNVQISADRNISLQDVRDSLIDLPKYSVSEKIVKLSEPKNSYFETYRPLLVVFIFILLVSTAFQLSLPLFSAHLFMNHIMAGFFIGFSFFKFFPPF